MTIALAFSPSTYGALLAVALLPLGAWVLQVFFGRFLPRKGDWLPTGAMGIAAIIAVANFIKVLGVWEPGFELGAYLGEHITNFQAPTWGWFSSSTITPADARGLDWFRAGILYDNLGAAMLAMVATVSFLVHLFSVGYMQGDRRYNIFFSNLSLFTFAMLGLVLSDNLLFLFIFWELMGLCSYLLIGHLALDGDQAKDTASWASLKAFMTTRIGDICLLIGMLMLWKHFHTLNLHELYAAVASATSNGAHWEGWMTVAGILVFLGAVGKSAQFPLHVWLPDAMEGPTPVSAMIHAATMVAAGVYLTGRVFLLLSPEAQLFVAVIGAFTAIFAATIGITSFDIKKVLAYSTISQLGYMIAAIGVGGVAAGLFHVITHALFKACLFLGSGSVIHGCHHEQDMREMGGLRKKMPITYITMLVSTLAISGVPLFAGFYSKDAIIAKSLEKAMMGEGVLWAFPFWCLVIAAAITAFYMFRLIFMTFHGQPRGHGADHAHESPWTMTVPLILLGLGAVFGGKMWAADPAHAISGGSEPWFLHLVEDPELADWSVVGSQGADHGAAAAAASDHADSHGAAHGDGHDLAHVAHERAMIFSLVAAGSGILLACCFYLWRLFSAAAWARRFGALYTLVYNKYWFDELYNATAIRFTMWFSHVQRWIDTYIIDGLVNGIGRVMTAIAGLSGLTDRYVVDGVPNWSADASVAIGHVMRRTQTGRIQNYALFTVGGVVLLAAVVLLDDVLGLKSLLVG